MDEFERDLENYLVELDGSSFPLDEDIFLEDAESCCSTLSSKFDDLSDEDVDESFAVSSDGESENQYGGADDRLSSDDDDVYAQILRMQEQQRVRWKCEEEKYFNENYNQDFPLMKNLSDWLCDLTSTNTDGDSDGVTTVKREWYIFHRTPGHIVIFLDLFSEDLTNRIQYPFKEPENWKNRPLRRANRKEKRINLYDELVVKRQELEAQGLYSKTH